MPASWVTLVSQGAFLVDRAYHLLTRTSPYHGAGQHGAGQVPTGQASARIAQPAARPAEWQQVLRALQTAHRVLDALEGKPPPRRGLFW
ncbi:MAG TPA: hypothetical protein GXX28_03805 [Firmicutes bacterium]|nr:hypothetical protein [Bacillota bacterium]